MKCIYRLAVFLLILCSCKRDNPPLIEESFVSFINTVASQPRLSIYVDTVFQFRIPYTASYRNLQLTPGPHAISVRDSSRAKTYLNIASQEFIANTTSTVIIYDTLHPVDSTVRGIRLNDDLTLAPNGFVKVRFIHAAPRTNTIDLTFVRTSVSPFDSITFSSQAYIGNTPNVPALSAFNNIPIGNYTLKVKAAGTPDTIMNTIKLSVSNLAGSAGITGITTFYLTGGVPDDSLRVGLFRHYP